MNLPGYSDRGKRFAGEWDASHNPTKATAEAWVTFLQSNKNFPCGGVPALEQDAPILGDYKKWVAKAAK